MRTVRILAAFCAVLMLMGCHAEEEPADTYPPWIQGTHPLHINRISRGELSLDPLDGVTAYDSVDGYVPVEVDMSAVNTERVGEYTVIYSASDKAGNLARVEETVYVHGYNGNPVSRETVDDLADSILTGILTEDMTDRDKVETIYDWIRANVSYRQGAEELDLIGMLPEAAYEGLQEGHGNCYTFYAVSEILLTQAGIPNIPVTQKEPEHYWNLVKVDGEWFHYDATPAENVPDSRRCLVPMDIWVNYGTYNPEDMKKWEGSN